MKFLHKYGTRRNEIRRAKREFLFRVGIIAAILVFFAIMIVVTKFRPRLPAESPQLPPQEANLGDPQSNPSLIRMRQEVDDLLSQYKEASSQSDVELDDLSLLEQAIDKQRAIIRTGGSDIASKIDLDRLRDLETILDEEMGAFLVSESRQLEQDADTKWAGQDYPEALELLQKARDLQEQVNSQYPKSPDRSPSRLHVLKNKIMSWQTGPLAEAADQLKAEAMTELDRGNHDLALGKITRALEIQQQISTEFRSSRFASIARMKEFEESYRKIETAEDRGKTQTLLANARNKLDNGEIEDALETVLEAEKIHLQVMDRYPEAMAQHAETTRAIDILKDTCSSHSAFTRILSLQAQTRQALMRQDMKSFQSQVSEWYRELRVFQKSYPNSEYLEQCKNDEVNYLYEMRESIPSVMDMTYENLVPVPGQSQLHLYRTEVPQVLYAKVTGNNPSVSIDPAQPVESITWEEAAAFNRQLGWILARPVALPGREVFESALGSGDPAELAARSWSSESSNRQIQPVGTSEPNDLGFNDLLGNVSEWLDADGPSPKQVSAIGGAARDARYQLVNIPVESRDPYERNRFIGFRFTVKITD
jgi:hypothetical protein